MFGELKIRRGIRIRNPNLRNIKLYSGVVSGVPRFITWNIQIKGIGRRLVMFLSL